MSFHSEIVPHNKHNRKKKDLYAIISAQEIYGLLCKMSLNNINNNTTKKKHS